MTVSRTAPLYAGTSLTLTCTVTLDLNVDNGERVMTEWSDPRDISGERYSVTAAGGSGSTYTGSLTISPLADQDDGTYTCTGTVTGGINVQQANASDNVTINVIGKNSVSLIIVLLYHYLLPSLKLAETKGSIGHSFTVCIRTEYQNQARFYPFVPREISVLTELALGHLHYRLTDVPPPHHHHTHTLTQLSQLQRFPYLLPDGPPLLTRPTPSPALCR